MLDSLVGIGTLLVSLVTLGGLGFGLGRLYGRVDSLEKGQHEIKRAIDSRLSEVADRVTFLERAGYGTQATE